VKGFMFTAIKPFIHNSKKTLDSKLDTPLLLKDT